MRSRAPSLGEQFGVAHLVDANQNAGAWQLLADLHPLGVQLSIMIPMTYVVVAIVGVLFASLGFALKIVSGNITHVTNGRQPNARAALFPTIPFTPAYFVGFAWLLDQMREGLGLWTTVGLFAAYVPLWKMELRRLNLELESKMLATNIESIQPNKENQTDPPLADHLTR